MFSHHAHDKITVYTGMCAQPTNLERYNNLPEYNMSRSVKFNKNTTSSSINFSCSTYWLQEPVVAPQRRSYLASDVNIRHILREWIHWRGFLSIT